MKAGLWYEGVTGWPEILFWNLVLVGILVYTWWTRGNGDEALIIVVFLGLFLEFHMSTRQIERLMRRTKEIEDQMHILKDLQDRMYILETQAK